MGQVATTSLPRYSHFFLPTTLCLVIMTRCYFSLCRRYKWNTTRTQKLSGQQLEISKRAKYQGLILVKKLTWKNHFENKCNKFIALWLCRRAIRSNWGLKPDILLWIFTAILQPGITYAPLVWWIRVKQKTTMASLERLRGLILRGITGASKFSPKTTLGVLMGLKPLHLTVTAEAGKATWRIGKNTSTVISKKLRTTDSIARRPIMKMVGQVVFAVPLRQKVKGNLVNHGRLEGESRTSPR